MKTRNTRSVFIIVMSMFCSSQLLAVSLEVNLDGFHNDTGQALVYLHDTADYFPTKPKKAISMISAKLSNKRAKAIFRDIEPGIYAIAVVHDENNDGELETNFIGIPKEGVGASNNARGRFGPPEFSDASFKLHADLQLQINIHY